MTSQVLAGLLLRQPFRPFRFMFSDNIEVHFERPEEVKHEPGDRIATVAGSYGAESIIDLDLMALIEVEGRP